MTTDRLFSTYQVAQLLGATPAAVSEWINNGQLPCMRFPNGPERIPERSLIQFLKQQGVDIKEIMAKVALREGSDYEGIAEEEPAPATSPQKSPDMSEDSSSQVAQAIPQKEESVPPTHPKDIPDTSEDSSTQVAEAIIQDAVDRHASYIHLENHTDGLALRLRIDGVLRNKINFKSRLPKTLAPKLTAHFKLLAGLDSGPHDQPQTGQFTLPIGGREISFRLTSCPTIHGEKLLLRILDRDSDLLSLSELGLDAEDQIRIKVILSRMSGLLVVAAPPGNGRNTTLRAMLAQLDCQERNILTIEKSPDHEFEGVNQSRVNPLGGFTFAKAMSVFAAMDVDAIMAEEIRDPPSAHAALEMAISGSLVLAGINASIAAEAIAVLLEMGLERYALASSLKGVIAQRTSRKICRKCRQQIKPATELLDRLGLEPEQIDFPFYAGQGCSSCSNSGYSGRVGIFETLWLDSDVAELFRRGADVAAIQQAAQQAGMQSLQQVACEKARSGLISLEEMSRVLSRWT